MDQRTCAEPILPALAALRRSGALSGPRPARASGAEYYHLSEGPRIQGNGHGCGGSELRRAKGAAGIRCLSSVLAGVATRPGHSGAAPPGRAVGHGPAPVPPHAVAAARRLAILPL